MNQPVESYVQLAETMRLIECGGDPDRRLAERLQYEEDRYLAELIALENHPRPGREPEHVIKFRALLALHRGLSLVDPRWETIDPTPDIHAMFQVFDDMFFESRLRFCTIGWSKADEMKSCAGQFGLQDGFPRIWLSHPLLLLRPRSDLVQTLLHEMIHAYIFVTGMARYEGRGGHGPEFHRHMNRINALARCNIRVAHSFHDEVRYYRGRYCGCNQPCTHPNAIYIGMPAVLPACQWWDFYDHYYGLITEGSQYRRY
ncbi:sprT-like domain-containing protein Spartan [Varroa jacobsoni]|uniref:sprT-like domain-containing protein Spartan n=1 Tax=Varroa jacobsoni TaxID=62625 RepID=UPI000BF9E1DB|nr:sprT-like domain-containing protein Spartan [Varroa jacobsoni]